MKRKILLVVMLLLLVVGCGKKEEKDLTSGTIGDTTYKETEEVTNYIKIELENNKVILAELYPDIAPVTVENFQKLVKDKFYDGIIFHRVIKNFMIQTGDPTGIGTGGSEKTIKGEFRRNGITNNLKHERGVLSMARSNDMDSASSQFFIVHKTYPSLDGSYAAFGCVLEGMDVVDEIASVETDENDKPKEEIKMRSIRFVEIEK